MGKQELDYSEEMLRLDLERYDEYRAKAKDKDFNIWTKDSS